jgi:hypothetical protein
MNRILKWLGIVLLVLVVLGLGGVVAARAYFTRYLHSEAFRKSLGEAAAKSLHADSAEFAPLEFDGSTVYGENFSAARSDGGGFSSLNADQLRASFDWHGLLRHTVQIDEMAVARLDIEPPLAPAPAAAVTENPSSPAESPAPLTETGSGWTVDLRKAVFNEVNWKWDPSGSITGAALTLTPDTPSGWIIDSSGGTVSLAGWPALDLDSASMRWQNPVLYINSADLRNGTGRLNVTGSIEIRKSVDLQVKFDGVDVQPLLSPDWRERLSGRLTGTSNIEAPLGTGQAASQLNVSGSIALVDGQLTALPILDEIGTFTHTQRFRTLELTRASANFSRTPDRIDVSGMVVESEGLIRVDGAFTVIDGQIDGDFQVGLTPATLQWIPGSQELIFTDSRGGYRWTSMHLSGPLTHPVDDLTPRLLAATGKAVLKGAEDVEGVVKKTGEGLLDFLTH